MMTLGSFHRFLIYCFVFFGPLGTLLSPSFMPYAFRFYHFFLIFSPLFFIKLRPFEWKMVLTFVPFLAYCLISAYFTHNKSVHEDAYPLFRCFLLVSQCLFMFGAAFCLRDRDQAEEKKRLIRLYLSGFFISLVIGYIFYLGYYSGRVSLETIQKYSVEVQMGWGLLRFSPGTYPNEYGNVASFALSLLLILYADKKRFSLFLFFSLTFIAFLLTTTRAAYLSFLVTLVYLCMSSSVIRKILLKYCLICLSVLLILKYYSIDFFKIFIAGVKAISLSYGSTGIRFAEWVKGIEELNASAVLGTGFGANILVHNVYLEILYELGLLGVVILLTSLTYYLSENSRRFRLFFERKPSLYKQVTMVGLIHVFLFAGSNHNMHHHLTWFTFLLLNMTLFAAVEEGGEAPSLNKPQPSPLS